MNKKIVIIPIVVIVLIILVSFSSDETSIKKNTIFHITLADPKLYVDGVYTEKFTVEEGEYVFRFVPNGSSPEILSITLNGKSFDFSENFEKIGILHQTGISEYYTWDYDGQKNIIISEMQEILITINPNGKTIGSVSVDILKN